MRPENLKTKIFLDSGDPNETIKIINLLGFLDGQTTNPTLISKNPLIRANLEKGEKLTQKEIWDFYRQVVIEISKLIPHGSVSIEVYADLETSAKEIFKQAQEMFSWIPNAHIKLPITNEGLMAAEQAVKEGIRINLTLCFSQEQAAAAYVATRGAKKGDVFISPFVGRLDDIGENGMDLIANILRMYQNSDHHIEVLTASVRNINHFLCALQLGTDIITAPFRVLKEWAENGCQIPKNNFIYNPENLKSIPYQNLDLNKNWREFNIYHPLTLKGIKLFSDDWNSLIKNK